MRDTRGDQLGRTKKGERGKKVAADDKQITAAALYFLFDLPFGKGDGWILDREHSPIRLTVRFHVGTGQKLNH